MYTSFIVFHHIQLVFEKWWLVFFGVSVPFYYYFETHYPKVITLDNERLLMPRWIRATFKEMGQRLYVWTIPKTTFHMLPEGFVSSNSKQKWKLLTCPTFSWSSKLIQVVSICILPREISFNPIHFKQRALGDSNPFFTFSVSFKTRRWSLKIGLNYVYNHLYNLKGEEIPQHHKIERPWTSKIDELQYISIWFPYDFHMISYDFIWFHMISHHFNQKSVMSPCYTEPLFQSKMAPGAIETAFENHQGTLLGWNVNDSQPQLWMFSSHSPSELVEIESTVSICFTWVSYCRTCLCRMLFIKQYDFNMWKNLITFVSWSFSPDLTYGCRQVDHLNFVSCKTPLDSKVTYLCWDASLENP